MRAAISFMLLFTIAVGLALLAQSTQGYALLFVHPYRVELSVNALVLLFVGLLLAGFALLRLLDLIAAMPQTVKRYQQDKRNHAARRLRSDAITALIEGRYQKSVRAIRQARELEDDDSTRLLDSLIGARAADFGRDFATRDQYLDEARSASNGRSLALHMLEAEMLYEQHRPLDAMQALQKVYAQSSRLTAALKLELKIRQAEPNPKRVIALTEQLLKNEAIEPRHAARILQQARLQQLSSQHMDETELAAWWDELSSSERDLPQLAAACARQWLHLGQGERAENLLVDALEAEWDTAPLEVYGELARLGARGDPVKRLARAEDWLRHHPNEPQLLLALGRLCCSTQLWGKARNYLEASIAVAATPQAHAELAQLLERLDERSNADHHYRASLGLALDLLEKRK